MRTAPLLLGAALLLVSACTATAEPTAISAVQVDEVSPPTDAHPTPDMAPVDWTSCDDEIAVDPDLECATVTVPIDYSLPDGGRLDLALVRVPASGDREGAVLFNPGGPGGSGFDYVAQAGTAVADALGLEHLDLIGFDPRGVDRSGGLRCQTDAEIDRYQFLDDTPDTPEEQALLDGADAAFRDACLAKYGDTLRHYSTDNTAQDMDAIRAALGDDTISFLGISYGTYLGATYATLFPDRVRALVLDSAYEPTGDSVEQQYTTQLVGFEHAFDDWAAWCGANDACDFRSDDVPAAWDALYEQLDASPLTNDDGREANQAVMGLATIAALYSEVQWPVLGAALADAQEGDPSGIFSLADGYNQRDEDGRYATIGQSNPIISCASGLRSEPPDDPEALAQRLRDLAPRFARDVDAEDFEDDCDGLVPAVSPRELRYDGDAPILVVGGTNDPATPFRWAEEMTAAMGDSATLVTFTGEGHGQLMSSTCVTELEAATLTSRSLPEDGTVCDPDPDVPKPTWWDSLPVPDGVDDVFVDGAVLGMLGLSANLAYAEVRTTGLEVGEALERYVDALTDAGFTSNGMMEPLPGAQAGLFVHESGELLNVVILGDEAMASPELEGLADVVPDGKALVVLLRVEL